MNMGVNIVVYGGDTLIDLSGDTTSEDNMLSGVKAHDKAGNPITGAIPSRPAQTITPGTADQTIQAGQYLAGDQTIKGDANLIPANIAKGVSIFGVTGSHEGSGGGSGGTFEACSVDYDIPAEDGFIFYVDDYGDPCAETFETHIGTVLQSVAVGSALAMFFEGTPNNDPVCENAEFIEGRTSEGGLSVYTFKIYGDASITFG